jgi:hypothetical protein
LGFVDRQVETREQLSYILPITANKHRHSLMAVMGDRHAPGGANYADGDLAMLNEFLDVGQGLV